MAARDAIAGLIGLSQDGVAPPAPTLPSDPRSALRAAQAGAGGGVDVGAPPDPPPPPPPLAVPFSQGDLPSQHVLDSQDLSRTPVPLAGGGGGVGGDLLLPGTGGALPAGLGGAALDLSAPAPALDAAATVSTLLAVAPCPCAHPLPVRDPHARG